MIYDTLKRGENTGTTISSLSVIQNETHHYCRGMVSGTEVQKE